MILELFLGKGSVNFFLVEFKGKIEIDNIISIVVAFYVGCEKNNYRFEFF